MPVRPLTPALAEKARTELNEDANQIEEQLRHFKQWILNQKHLRARTDDQWLIAFLRGCKYRMEQAKSKIDLYYSLRSTIPYLYPLKYKDPKLMEYLDSRSVIILPKTTNPTDPRFALYRLGKYDTKDKSMVELLSVLAFMEQICFMEDDSFVVAGTVHILDFAGTKLSHYTQTSVSQIRSLSIARQDALPIRIKRIHFLNTPFFFGTFFNIAKIFLTAKNRQRILFHKDIKSLHEHVPKEILPKEYGGYVNTQEAIDNWKNKLREYNSFFEEDSRYGSDETKRPRKNQSVDFD